MIELLPEFQALAQEVERSQPGGDESRFPLLLESVTGDYASFVTGIGTPIATIAVFPPAGPATPPGSCELVWRSEALDFVTYQIRCLDTIVGYAIFGQVAPIAVSVPVLTSVTATDYRIRGDIPMLYQPIDVQLAGQYIVDGDRSVRSGVGNPPTTQKGRRTIGGLRAERVCYPNGRVELRTTFTQNVQLFFPPGVQAGFAVTLQFASVADVLADRYTGIDRVPTPPPGAVYGWNAGGPAEPTRRSRRAA